jgi:hypothetical protein
MKKLVISIFFLFNIISMLFVDTLKAELEIQPFERWQYFKVNFFSKPEYVENMYLIAFYYGLDFPKINSQRMGDDFFNNLNQLRIDYGFIRFDDEIHSGIDIGNIFKHTSEYIHVSNYSTNFKTFDLNKEGINADIWQVGFGLKDGFGLLLPNGNNLMLNHSTAFVWSEIDLDRFGSTDELNHYLKRYYRKVRFGQSYSAGISYQLSNSWLLDINYENNIIYPYFEGNKWFPMWLMDNILQRWIDYYELDMIKEYKEKYPLMKFAYKTMLSTALFEMRKRNMYFPFKSDDPYSMNGFTISFRYVF